MGYTTEFVGVIDLERKLTFAEAKELLEVEEAQTRIAAYFQWVPTETLDGIVWDGNEKFYKYTEQLVWLCDWLKARGISASGSLYWQGESAGDMGAINVIENVVSVHSLERPSSKSNKPLWLEKLQEMEDCAEISFDQPKVIFREVARDYCNQCQGPCMRRPRHG